MFACGWLKINLFSYAWQFLPTQILNLLVTRTAYEDQAYLYNHREVSLVLSISKTTEILLLNEPEKNGDGFQHFS